MPKNKKYVLTGTMTDQTVITLSEPLPIQVPKVRVVVEVPVDRPRLTMEEFLAQLRDSQAARGYVPRTAEEVHAQIEADRNSWDDKT